MALNQIIRSFEPKTGGVMPYSFHEYPKHVYPNGPAMPFVQVNSAEEEAEAMASGTVMDPDTEKKRLLAVAEQKGLAMDGRWKIEKMRATLSNAGYDPDFNPFK